MVGLSPLVNLSALPGRATVELNMHLIFHTLPLGFAAFGLSKAELRSQGSCPGRILEKTIWIKHFGLKIKSIALVKSICPSHWDILCANGPVPLSFL